MASPSPICTVKNGSGTATATSGYVDVTPGNTVTIALVSTAGVGSWALTCVGTDELLSAATITSSLTINNTTKTATFPAPVAGSALIFRSVVNGGIDINGSVSASLVSTFKVTTLTTGGQRVGAWNETIEHDPVFGSLPIVNTTIRNIDSALTGIISGTATSAVTASSLAIGDVVCSANDSTDATKVTKATPTALANGAVVLGISLQAVSALATVTYAPVGTKVAAASVGLPAGSPSMVIVGSVQTWSLPTATLTGANVGQTLVISNATSTQNNGSFKVVSVIDSTHCTASNPYPNPVQADGNNTHISWNVGGQSGATAACTALVGSKAQRQEYCIGSEYIVGYCNAQGHVSVFPRQANGHPVINVLSPVWGVVGDGVTDDGPALQTAIRAGGKGATIVWPPAPNSRGRYVVKTKIVLGDSATEGNIRSQHWIGTGGSSIGSTASAPTVMWDGVEQSGTTASITAFTGGTNPQNYQTVSLPGATLTSANVDEWLEIWGASNEAHNGRFLIMEIIDSTTCRVSNLKTGAAATDTNNGSISWLVETCMFDIRCREMIIEHIEFAVFPRANRRVTCLINLTESRNAGALVVTSTKFQYCIFTTEQTQNGAAAARWYVKIAQHICPAVGNAHYSSTNNQPYAPFNGDFVTFSRCNFNGPALDGTTGLSPGDHEGGITVQNTTGQSKGHSCIDCSFANLPHGFIIPDLLTGTTGTSRWNASCDFTRCNFQVTSDYAIQLGGANYICHITGGIHEGPGLLLNWPEGAQSLSGVVISGGHYAISSWNHPAVDWISMNSNGPLTISGAIFQITGTRNWTIRTTAAGANTFPVSIQDSVLPQTSHVGGSAVLNVTRKGPYSGLAGTSLTLNITVAGVTTPYTVNFVSGDFFVSGRQRTQEVAKKIATVLGSAAQVYGSADQQTVKIRTASTGVTTTIQVTGGTANAILGYPTTVANGAAQTDVSVASGGLVDSATGASRIRLNIDSKVLNGGTDIKHLKVQAWCGGSDDTGGTFLTHLRGLSSDIRTGQNLVVQRDFLGTETEVFVRLPRSETADSDYRVVPSISMTRGSGIPAGATRISTDLQSPNGFVAKLETAPGANNIVSASFLICRGVRALPEYVVGADLPTSTVLWLDAVLGVDRADVSGNSLQTWSLPGATLTSANVGQTLTISGAGTTTGNNGQFTVLSVIDATHLTAYNPNPTAILADSKNGIITWSVGTFSGNSGAGTGATCTALISSQRVRQWRDRKNALAIPATGAGPRWMPDFGNGQPAVCCSGSDGLSVAMGAPLVGNAWTLYLVAASSPFSTVDPLFVAGTGDLFTHNKAASNKGFIVKYPTATTRNIVYSGVSTLVDGTAPVAGPMELWVIQQPASTGPIVVRINGVAHTFTNSGATCDNTGADLLALLHGYYQFVCLVNDGSHDISPLETELRTRFGI